MNQENKPELLLPSGLAAPTERLIRRVGSFGIFLFFVYIVFSLLSAILVRMGNAQFSKGNEKLGTTSYKLALEFKSGLKNAVNQCYDDNVKKQYARRNNEWSRFPVPQVLFPTCAERVKVFGSQNDVVDHGLIVRESPSRQVAPTRYWELVAPGTSWDQITSGMYWERTACISNRHPADCVHAWTLVPWLQGNLVHYKV